MNTFHIWIYFTIFFVVSSYCKSSNFLVSFYSSRPWWWQSVALDNIKGLFMVQHISALLILNRAFSSCTCQKWQKRYNLAWNNLPQDLAANHQNDIVYRNRITVLLCKSVRYADVCMNSRKHVAWPCGWVFKSELRIRPQAGTGKMKSCRCSWLGCFTSK